MHTFLIHQGGTSIIKQLTYPTISGGPHDPVSKIGHLDFGKYRVLQEAGNWSEKWNCNQKTTKSQEPLFIRLEAQERFLWKVKLYIHFLTFGAPTSSHFPIKSCHARNPYGFCSLPPFEFRSLRGLSLRLTSECVLIFSWLHPLFVGIRWNALLNTLKKITVQPIQCLWECRWWYIDNRQTLWLERAKVVLNDF